MKISAFLSISSTFLSISCDTSDFFSNRRAS
jgi:hypothetical protein